MTIRGAGCPSTTAVKPANRSVGLLKLESPRQIARTARIWSRRCWRRSSVAIGTVPIASCSTANREPGTAPEPMPSRIRPGANDCSELMALANCTG